MREPLVEQIKTNAEGLEGRFDAFIKQITSYVDEGKTSLDLSQQITDTDSSISDLRARVSAIFGLLRKLDSKGAELVPYAHLNALIRSNRAVRNSFDQIESSIKTFDESNGGVQRIDPSTMSFTANNGQTTEFMSQFKPLFDNVETYILNFQNVFQITSPTKAAFNFSAATKALSNVISRADGSRERLEKSLATATRKLEQIAANESETERSVTAAKEALSSINDHSAKANEAVAHISAKNDEATALGSVAQDLKNAVERYRTEFDSFQLELDARRNAIESGNSDLSTLVAKFREQEQQFDDLIEKSDKMLSGATVAGLASEFGTMRTELSTELSAAHKSFNWSIGILGVSAVPLILFIFSPFIAPFISSDDRIINAIAGISSDRGSWQYLGQVIARLVILLPAVWYVTFCSTRYNSLFKLREHYAYKYSMAVAVEGFKKQSPGHEDMIAALVFEQLSFNPADKLGRQPNGPQSPPNPIAELFLRMLRKDEPQDT